MRLLILALCIFALGAMQGVSAAELYKYQDEHGRWQFTDKPPNADVETVTTPLEIFEPKKLLTIVNRGSQQRPMLYAVNHSHGPLDVLLEVTGQNLNTDKPNNRARLVLSPNSTELMMTMTPYNPRLGWNWRWQWDYVLGAPDVQPELAYRYAIPFEAGGRYPISQGFNGEFSHTSESSKYAIDIAMPEGTPILAARAGTVATVEKDFFRKGADVRLLHKANVIRIIHSDGTIGVYAHLQQNSIDVRPGDTVSRGQQIARSGNTGFSTGPHLHFVIQRNDDGEISSVKFHLDQPNTGMISPVEGMVLDNSDFISR